MSFYYFRQICIYLDKIQGGGGPMMQYAEGFL